MKFVPLIFLEALCGPHKGNNNNNNTVVIITAQLRIRIKSKHSDPLILEAQIRVGYSEGSDPDPVFLRVKS